MRNVFSSVHASSAVNTSGQVWDHSLGWRSEQASRLLDRAPFEQKVNGSIKRVWPSKGRQDFEGRRRGQEENSVQVGKRVLKWGGGGQVGRWYTEGGLCCTVWT